jgi:hypothetical protein
MPLQISEIRKLDRKFAFTVQLGELAKPLEVVCENEDVAHRRVAALRAADCAYVEAVHGPHPH